MILWVTIGEILTRWTDTVATGIVALANRLVSPRVIRLVEDEAKPDSFTVQGGQDTWRTDRIQRRALCQRRA